MCTEKELSFSTFIFYSLSGTWNKTPADVYKILNSTGVLDDYIIEAYDVLHTLGKEYLAEDITELVREKGVCVTLHELDSADRIVMIYKRELENNVILDISKMKKIEIRKAMDMYYSSNLAIQIAKAKKPIENMDAKKLAKAVIKSKEDFQR